MIEEKYPLAPCPTRALPGTLEKVRVMMWRYHRGYALFHPLDAKWSDVGIISPGVKITFLRGFDRIRS